MQKLWTRLKAATTSKTQLRDELLELVPQLTHTYGEAAAQLAVEWYEDARQQEIGVDGWHASMKGVSGYPTQAIQDTIRWKAGILWDSDADNPDASTHADPDALATFLQGAVDRWVHYSGSEAIITSVAKDPKAEGYAVVPAGKCCAWCAMIASRGFAYTSAMTAHASTHSGCDCEICPSWGNERQAAILEGYDPDTYYRMYKKAADDITLDPQNLSKQIASAKTQDQKKNLEEELSQIVALRNDMHNWWPSYRKNQAVFDGTSDIASYKTMARRLGADRMPQSVKRHAITSLMRYQNPDEFTDGSHPGNIKIGDLRLGDWLDFRSSLAQRRIKTDSRSFKMPPETPARVPDGWPSDLPSLTTCTWNHILYGSHPTRTIKHPDSNEKKRFYTGGHLHGYGWIASRDEFPEVWDQDDILKAAVHVLRTSTPTARGTYFGEYNGSHLYVSTIENKDGIRVKTITPYTGRRP